MMECNLPESTKEQTKGFDSLVSTLNGTTLNLMKKTDEKMKEMYMPIGVEEQTQEEIYSLFQNHYKEHSSAMKFFTMYGEELTNSLGDHMDTLIKNLSEQTDMINGWNELIVVYKAQTIANELLTTDKVESVSIATIQDAIDALDILNITYFPGLKELLQQYVNENN